MRMIPVVVDCDLWVVWRYVMNMPIMRIQIDRDGEMASNIHLGAVSETDFDSISREIMTICYRRQKE